MSKIQIVIAGVIAQLTLLPVGMNSVGENNLFVFLYILAMTQKSPTGRL